jgi:leucyl aminopeptidase
VISLTSSDPFVLSVDALVVIVAQREGAPVAVGHRVPPFVAEVLAEASALGVTGALDEVRKVPATAAGARILVLAGAGPEQQMDGEALRRATGAATRELGGLASAAVVLPADDLPTLRAVAEGALLGAYDFDRYRSADPSRAPLGAVQVVTRLSGAHAQAELTRAQVVAQAVHATRDLVNTAPNDLYPEAFAEAARTAVKGLRGVKITVLDEKALAAGGYGGLLGVGQGSARPPRLVKVAYSAGRTKRSVALVGKGITFDSGGISLKPPADMDEMKSDMAGAAAVLSTVVAAAKLGLKVSVTGWLCLAENMPSGTAQRPSDVLTIRGGKTVEVLNTDAEGRLVLADGLVSAVEEKPDLVLDIATLTGAQMVALGRRVSAVMGTDEVRGQVVEAAGAAGEQFWPMPLPEDLKAGLKSKVADLANVGERWGGMLLAGLFLAEFVGDTPWAHLDVAGPAFNARPAYGYTPVGGTGAGVRTMLGVIEGHAANS